MTLLVNLDQASVLFDMKLNRNFSTSKNHLTYLYKFSSKPIKKNDYLIPPQHNKLTVKFKLQWVIKEVFYASVWKGVGVREITSTSTYSVFKSHSDESNAMYYNWVMLSKIHQILDYVSLLQSWRFLTDWKTKANLLSVLSKRKMIQAWDH